MNQFVRWATMTPRQRMLEAMSGGAHPTMGLEVRDSRTGAQLGIEALQGLGAEPLIRSGLTTIEANRMVSMRTQENGMLMPESTVVNLAPVSVVSTQTTAPAPDVSARFVATPLALRRQVPTSVYSTDPTSAVRTEETPREQYTFARGEEGGAPDDYYSPDPSSKNVYSEDQPSAYDDSSLMPVEQRREENPILQTAANSRAAATTGPLTSVRGWWETQSTGTKMLIGAAALFAGYKLLK